VGSNLTLDGNGVKAMQGQLKYTQSWFIQLLKKKFENTGSQMGHTKKKYIKKKIKIIFNLRKKLHF
jgi:hypothetical protein